MKVWLLCAMIAGVILATPLAAKNSEPEARPIFKRDQWLPPSVTTSDDVLRIPVPANDNAPEGSFV